MFVGVMSYKGFQYSFDIDHTSPASTDLIGSSRIIGNAMSLFALAFYGYSETCPGYLTMACQPCPQYCQTCHVWPTFHCFECNPNFILAPDKLSCTCNFSIVNELCGDLPPHCQVAKFQKDWFWSVTTANANQGTFSIRESTHAKKSVVME